MMRKARGGLFPADAYAAEQYDQLPEGKELSVRVSVMSSTGKTQREGARGLWFGGLELLSQNVDDVAYDSKAKAKDSILRELGYVRPRYLVGNRVEYIPISTSEAEMPDEEFLQLMERSAALIEAKFGWNPWEAWKAEKDAEKANRSHI